MPFFRLKWPRLFRNKITSIGVAHSTIDRTEQGKRIPVDTVSKVIKELRGQSQTRVGLESRDLPDPDINSEIKDPRVVTRIKAKLKEGDFGRFWTALAKRGKEITFVPLENEIVAKALADATLWLEAANRHAHYGEEPKKYLQQLAITTDREYAEGNDSNLKCRTAILQALAKNLPKLNGITGQELDDAISVQRSHSMHKTALKQGITHIVVGAMHAKDLESAGKAKATYVNFTPLERYGQERMLNYKKHKWIARILEKAAINALKNLE